MNIYYDNSSFWTRFLAVFFLNFRDLWEVKSNEMRIKSTDCTSFHMRKRNERTLKGEWDENLKSPKSNYYWPLEQRGYCRSGCTVSRWLLWSPGLVYPSPGWPPVAWQPVLPDDPASCWRGRSPPASAVGRWTLGGDTRTVRRRRSLERRWQTFCPVWTPGRSLWRESGEIRDVQRGCSTGHSHG